MSSIAQYVLKWDTLVLTSVTRRLRGDPGCPDNAMDFQEVPMGKRTRRFSL